MSNDNISPELIRGHIDTIILRVLSESDNYGYEIIKAISKYSQGNYELKEPSLYSSLKRLETQKLITSYWGDESQGGRRKYYTLTPLGTETYEDNVTAWKIAKVIIDQLIEKEAE
ncbi:PadR family transcriptional regulator [Paenibacillus glacialis]|uniref:PadR family transcriptional regulator n=1 Tax=Paenibacillus glacialis TaxID=494026 RepID=A0A168KQ07_9BACL|nr:PadR family transcriptional regulator [Paenibacillus glacialis]OAB42315.1 PadR family transcriptional regulator [Paenibacillus glacialis]